MTIRIEKPGRNFHPILREVEDMLWHFLLENILLMDPKIRSHIRQKYTSGAITFPLYVLDEYDREVALDVEISENLYKAKSQPKKASIRTAKGMCIIGYDYISNSVYQNALSGFTPFRFLGFIRNASAHDNKFNLRFTQGDKRGEWKLQTNEKVSWRKKSITRSLHGKKCFNDFITTVHIFALLQDISLQLWAIDKCKTDRRQRSK